MWTPCSGLMGEPQVPGSLRTPGAGAWMGDMRREEEQLWEEGGSKSGWPCRDGVTRVRSGREAPWCSWWVRRSDMLGLSHGWGAVACRW